MLKVHFVAGTRAGRIVWLLEELGLDYEVNIMPFTKEGLKSSEHRARHALGRVPVLEDGDISIFESGAIVEYILERHKNGGLKPAPEDPRFPEYLQWFHYCEGMVMPPINTIIVHTLLLPPDRQDETVRGQAERLLAKSWLPVEAAMVGKDYLVGDFSAADTMLGHACIMSQRLGIITEDAFPLLSAYAARLLARPACAKAFAA